MAVSFATDIRPLFTQTDIDHMRSFCDLSKYDDVKTHAQVILDRLQGVGGAVMPPASTGGPWSPDRISQFRQWITDGLQP